MIEDKKKKKEKKGKRKLENSVRTGVDAKNRWVNNDDTPSKEQRCLTKGATATYVPACMERS